MVTKELNSKVVVATVESWMGTELARFKGRDSSGNAIDWREETANDYAGNDNGRKISTESEEYEERYNGQLEDMYVIGYDEHGNNVGIEFG